MVEATHQCPGDAVGDDGDRMVVEHGRPGGRKRGRAGCGKLGDGAGQGAGQLGETGEARLDPLEPPLDVGAAHLDPLTDVVHRLECQLDGLRRIARFDLPAHLPQLDHGPIECRPARVAVGDRPASQILDRLERELGQGLTVVGVEPGRDAGDEVERPQDRLAGIGVVHPQTETLDRVERPLEAVLVGAPPRGLGDLLDPSVEPAELLEQPVGPLVLSIGDRGAPRHRRLLGGLGRLGRRRGGPGRGVDLVDLRPHGVDGFERELE